MPSLKDRATKAVDRAAKNIQKQVSDSIDSVVDRTEDLRAQLEKRVEETADETRRRAARLALSVLDFQKTTYDHTFKLVSQLQERSESAVSGVLHDAGWLPGEGKAVVKEWVHLMKSSRSDFNKTMGKSFDLITEYLKRVEKEAHKASAKPAMRSDRNASVIAASGMALQSRVTPCRGQRPRWTSIQFAPALTATPMARAASIMYRLPPIRVSASSTPSKRPIGVLNCRRTRA